MVLGLYNASNAREGVKRIVSEIKIHQNFSHDAHNQASNGDIAVLILERSVTFSNYIRPICLPDPTENVFGVDGIVVGRGAKIDSRTAYNSVPRKEFFNSIDNLECLLDHKGSFSVASPNSFCALGIGDALCQGFYFNTNLKIIFVQFLSFLGMSGSSFSIYSQEVSKWILLGVASHALNEVCNATVFVNVPMFVDWILKNIKTRTKIVTVPKLPIMNKNVNKESVVYKKTKNLNPDCGVSKILRPSLSMINGTESYDGEHPWLVSLQAKRNDDTFMHTCGATIINEWSVVTGKILRSYCKSY